MPGFLFFVTERHVARRLDVKAKKTYHLVMNSIAIIFLVLFSSIVFASEIDSLTIQAKKIIKQAEQCLPKSDSSKTSFCTGFSLSKSEVETLVKGGEPACKKEIQSAGYLVITDNSAKKISGDLWNEFINSTQKAQTFHDEKIVAFKKETGFVDCFHELIHVFQQTKGKGELSPAHRYQVTDKIQLELDKKILEVEAFEKQGKIDRAKSVASSLSSIIEDAKKLNTLIDGLDEVEAHIYIYQNCDLLKCSEEDKETTVANLYQRSNLLPKATKEQIRKDAQQIIGDKKKVANAKAKAEWKPIAEKEQEKLASLLRKSWSDLLREIKGQGLKILAVDEKAVGKLPLENKIPEEIFKSLEKPQKEELSVIQDSKILRGEALGKFLCKYGTVKRPSLVLTKQATLGSAVHEFVHYKQSLVNPTYCDSVYGQKAVDNEFKLGKMSRAEHDQKLLTMQATNALAEQEVYSLLLKNRDALGEVENLNNEMMLKAYEEILK